MMKKFYALYLSMLPILVCLFLLPSTAKSGPADRKRTAVAVPPAIASITLPADGNYRVGAELTFKVNFSVPVTVHTASSPLIGNFLYIVTGTTTRQLEAVSLDNTSMTFKYTVTAADNDMDGIEIQQFVTYQAIIDENFLTLDPAINPAQWHNQIKLDNKKPSITGFSISPGHFGIGKMVTISVQFDEAVNVTGIPSIMAGTNEFFGDYKYAGGAGTNILRFEVAVPAGVDISAPLYYDQQITLNGGTITDLAGNDYNLLPRIIAWLTGAHLDGVPPAVTNMLLTDPSFTVKSGRIHFEIYTSEPVISADLQNLVSVNTDVTVNSKTVTQTGSSSFAIELDVTGVPDTVLPVSLTIPGPVPFTDLGGNPVTLSNTTPPYHIDEQAPRITGMTLPANRIYKKGEVLRFVVNTSEPVKSNVGYVQLGITLAQGGTVWATGQANPDGLTFDYMVRNGDLDYNTIQLNNTLRPAPLFPTTTITDWAGNLMPLSIGTIPSLAGISVDGVDPVITGWLPIPKKTYKIGDSIKIEGTISKNIFINGKTSILLVVTDTGYYAPSIPASAPNRLAYAYVVPEGKEGGIFSAGFHLDLNGSIRDTAGNDLQFSPGPAMDGVLLDGVRPLITRIATPVTYGKIGDEVWIDVTFNEQITSLPGAILKTKIGSSNVDMPFKELTDASTARFAYTIKDGDKDGTGVKVSGLSGVTDLAGNEPILSNSVPTSLLVDGIRPVLDSITLLSDRITNKRLVSYVLHMSKPVNTPFTPAFTTTGDISIDHTDFTVSGNDVMVDVTATGNNGTLQLTVDPSIVSITDAAGNAAVQHALTGETVLIDMTPPAISDFVPPADSIYLAGQVLTYTLTASENLVVKGGTPSIQLFIDNQAAVHVSMSSVQGKTMVFRYVIPEGLEDWNGAGYDGQLELNGSTITDVAGNPLPLQIPYDPNVRGPRIHAKIPAITSVSLYHPGLNAKDDRLVVDVFFDNAVKVSPEVSMSLQIGDKTVEAKPDPASLEGTYIPFYYTIEEGLYDMDGVRVEAIQLNGGAIEDEFHNQAKTNFTSETFADIKVDAILPEILSFKRVGASPSNKDTLYFDVVFSEKMQYVSQYRFKVVKSADFYYAAPVTLQTLNDTAYRIGVRVFGAGTVGLKADKNSGRDLAGNSMKQDSVLSELYTVDNYPPYVADMKLPAAGTYKIGDPITIRAIIPEPVIIAGGTPSIDLTLRTGGTVKAYLIRNEPGALTFQYIVKKGDFDGSGIGINPVLQLNDSKPVDAMGNVMYGPMDSVPATTAILVDGIPPTVTRLTQLDPTVTKATKVRYAIVFSEAVKGFTAADITVSQTGSIQPPVVSLAYPATDSIVVTADNVSGAGTLTLSISPAAATDMAGNKLEQDKVFSASYTIDNAAPYISDLVLPAAGIYKTGDPITIKAIIPEPVIIASGKPSIDLTLRTGGTVKAYLIRNEPGALTFQYIVKKGDLDGTGISINPVLQVNDSKPADATGNAINTAMNHVPAATAILVDGIPPTATRITQLDPPVTKANKVRYAIVFSEAVKGFTAADITVSQTGSIQPPVVSLAYPATDSIVVTADNVSGAGTLTLSISPAAAATDLAGNKLEQDKVFSASYTIDNVAPYISDLVLPAAGTYKTGDPITIRAIIPEPVIIASGTPSIDLTLRTGGTVKAYLIRNEPGALTFQYIVKKGDLDGTGISINPVLQVNDSKPADATGNAINTAMNHVPATTAILVDGIPPTVTRITQLDPPVTKATKVRYAIIFSEAVRGFTAADVSVNKTGSMQAPVVSLAYPATDSIVVTADNINGAGTLLLSIHQTAAATDLAGNPLEASPLTSTYTIDNQKPGNTAPTVADIPDASLCADVAVHTIVVGGISAGIETDQAITAAVVADKSFFSSLTVVNNNDGTVTIRYELKARASGDVRITLTIADNGGTENGGVDRVSKSFVLSVKPMPILPIIVTPEHDIPQGAQAVLTTSGAATYLWKDEPGIVSGKNTAILVVQPMETTTYIVTGTTSEGCIASAATTIRVDVPAKFEATNVLTPNGDGINDRWVIKNISRYPNNQVKIFDRSGRLIYTKSGYNNEWDGTLNGQVLAQDTYYYIVDLGEGGKLEKGFITILRNRK